MHEMKKCKRCHQTKEAMTDFYMCSGKWRSECKKCTIKRNVKYQLQFKPWRSRYVDDNARRIYMRAYYKKNREKFAQYRADFIARNPEYFRDYHRMRKEKT